MTEQQIEILLTMAMEFRKVPNGEFEREAKAIDAALQPHTKGACAGCVAKGQEIKSLTGMVEEEAYFRAELKRALERCRDHSDEVDAIVDAALGAAEGG